MKTEKEKNRGNYKESLIKDLKYLESNLEIFLENLDFLSDMIFDRYSIEKKHSLNSELIKSYNSTLLELRHLEKCLKEEKKFYESRLKELI